MNTGSKPRLAVIGAGPAGLMAAEAAARQGVAVTLFDQMPSAGRKFLLAGRGGLNLTHSEAFERFLTRYGAAEPDLHAALQSFGPGDLQAWCADLGQPTFTGSSGRVFPVGLKTSPLLRAWLRRLDQMGVGFRPRHRWTGWSPSGALMFDTPDGPATVEADASVLALGGASWPQLGSDGRWVETLARADITAAPLRPSNCGFRADWSPFMREHFEGEPLKNIALLFGGQTARGDAIVTRTGLEGGAVYALSGVIRDAVEAHGEAIIHLALRPDLSPETLGRKLAAERGRQSLANFLRKSLKLSPVAIGLLNEAFRPGTPDALAAQTSERLATSLNAVPVRLTGVAPIARAISSAGGVPFAELDDSRMLRRLPGTFVAGEMLDWEAPTGGYLLQACFSTGLVAGRHAAAWALQQDRS